MKYEIWDKKSKINGVEPAHFLNSTPFKNCTHDIILIYADNGKVSHVECKEILANLYNIDINLPIDEFMAQYQLALETLEKIEKEYREQNA